MKPEPGNSNAQHGEGGRRHKRAAPRCAGLQPVMRENLFLNYPLWFTHMSLKNNFYRKKPAPRSVISGLFGLDEEGKVGTAGSALGNPVTSGDGVGWGKCSMKWNGKENRELEYVVRAARPQEEI